MKRWQFLSPLRGDLNNDGFVDALDGDFIVTALGTPALNPGDRRDLNKDGTINNLDLETLATLCTRQPCVQTLAYEGDVSPRPNGSGTLTLADWVQVGRFVIGLDAITLGNEYQRADCAPKDTKGDGILNIADWVQAGRYAAGLDPLVAVGGPTTVSLSKQLLPSSDADERTTSSPHPEAMESPRTIQAQASGRDRSTLVIQLDALGNENALGFSLEFDPAAVQFVSATLESDGQSATLLVNSQNVKDGKLGLALALPAGRIFQNQVASVVKVQFATVGSNYPDSTRIRFSDTPVRCSLVNAQSQEMRATYTDGVLILRPRSTPRRGVIRR